MAPRGPQKGQKSILMGSLVVLDPNASPKKISSIFGTGCHKACTCPLNGAINIKFSAVRFILCCFRLKLNLHNILCSRQLPAFIIWTIYNDALS